MATVTSKVFRSGNSEAVRLPREVAFGRDMEVTIVRNGDVLTIMPKRPSIADTLAKLESLPKPDSIEKRDSDFWPERNGL